MENINKLKQKFIEAIETICRDYEQKQPEFKVGQWATDGLIKGRITSTGYDGGIVYLQDVETETTYTTNKYNIKLLTEDEIESHLRKICDEKYVGKKVKCLRNWDCDKINKEEAVKPYVIEYDRYWMRADNGNYICVYANGKFAEIIPDKKPLPKTREEYKEFLDDFWHALPEDDDMPGLVSDDFLNQYE